RLLDPVTPSVRAVGVHERRLGDVLRVRRVPQERERVVVDILHVLPVQRLERLVAGQDRNLGGDGCHLRTNGSCLPTGTRNFLFENYKKFDRRGPAAAGATRLLWRVSCSERGSR